ncbi:hypothetical protein DFH06DRAFT_1295049 [Mycena polygramma]|nr:hypothetical protein DFH06DRAFT_1295049 [Mycena polygramma]
MSPIPRIISRDPPVMHLDSFPSPTDVVAPIRLCIESTCTTQAVKISSGVLSAQRSSSVHPSHPAKYRCPSLPKYLRMRTLRPKAPKPGIQNSKSKTPNSHARSSVALTSPSLRRPASRSPTHQRRIHCNPHPPSLTVPVPIPRTTGNTEHKIKRNEIKQNQPNHTALSCVDAKWECEGREREEQRSLEMIQDEDDFAEGRESGWRGTGGERRVGQIIEWCSATTTRSRSRWDEEIDIEDSGQNFAYHTLGFGFGSLNSEGSRGGFTGGEDGYELDPSENPWIQRRNAIFRFFILGGVVIVNFGNFAIATGGGRARMLVSSRVRKREYLHHEKPRGIITGARAGCVRAK